MGSIFNGKAFLLTAAGVVLLAGVVTAALWMFAGPYFTSTSNATLAATDRIPGGGAPPEPARQLAQAPAPAAPSVPQRTETTSYDNWTVTCRENLEGAAKNKKVCSAILQLADQNRKSVVFAWFIGRSTAGGLLTVMQTPTGVLIQKGVELKVGSGNVRLLNYSSCLAQNCEASAVMDDGFTKEVMAGQAATVTIYALNGQGINFDIPLNGAGKAIGSIGR